MSMKCLNFNLCISTKLIVPFRYSPLAGADCFRPDLWTTLTWDSERVSKEVEQVSEGASE